MSYTLLDNRDKDLINQDINKVSEQYNIKNKFGSSIVTDDSADFSLMNFKLYGKTAQTTTTGAQLLSAGVQALTHYTNYNINNNVYELTTQIDGDSTVFTYAYWEYDVSIFGDATDITLSVSDITVIGSAKCCFILRTYDEDSNVLDNKISVTAGTLTVSLINAKKVLVLLYSNYGGVCSNGDGVQYTDVMLNTGTEALPWESYTGGLSSPNPQYPQPLESKGMWGNLADNVELVNATRSTTGVLTLGAANCISNEKLVPVNGGHTIYVNTSVGRFADMRYYFYDESQTLISTEGGYSTSKALIVPNNARYFAFQYVNASDYTKYIGAMLMVSEENLPYRPYTGQREIGSVIQNQNLFDITNISASINVVLDKTKGSVTQEQADTSTAPIFKLVLYKNNEMVRFVSNNGIAIGLNTISVELLSDFDRVIIGVNGSVRDTVVYYDFPITMPKGKYTVQAYFDNITQGSISFRDIQFEKGTVATKFEPYTKQSHISLVGDGLKGIPVTDASLATYTDENGQMWCSDYVDCERGVLVQRIGYKKANNDFALASGYTAEDSELFAIRVDNASIINEDKTKYLCNKLSYKIIKNINETGFYYAGNHFNVRIKGVSDAEIFNSLMGDAEFQYILETPIETPLTADEIASYKALHSNYKVTTVMNDCDAEMEVQYAGAEYESGLTDVINKSIDNKVGDINSKVLINGADYGIERIQIEETDGQLQLVFRAADGTWKGTINFDLAATTTE